MNVTNSFGEIILRSKNFLLGKNNFVNLGCGKTFHSSWDNFDLIASGEEVAAIDLLKPLPFKESKYDACYSSHVLEHFSRAQAPKFLREIHRILRPGGIVRIVVPDLEGLARAYLAELDAASQGDEIAISRHQWMSIELLDQMTRTFSGGFMGRLWYSRPLLSRQFINERLGNEAGKWIEKFDKDFIQGSQPLTAEEVFNVETPTLQEEVTFRNQGEIHRWMYDRISLGSLLTDAGFRDVYICKADQSRIPAFSTYLLDTDENGAVRKPDSLFMEGIR